VNTHVEETGEEGCANGRGRNGTGSLVLRIGNRKEEGGERKIPMGRLSVGKKKRKQGGKG